MKLFIRKCIILIAAASTGVVQGQDNATVAGRMVKSSIVNIKKASL